MLVKLPSQPTPDAACNCFCCCTVPQAPTGPSCCLPSTRQTQKHSPREHSWADRLDTYWPSRFSRTCRLVRLGSSRSVMVCGSMGKVEHAFLHRNLLDAARTAGRPSPPQRFHQQHGIGSRVAANKARHRRSVHAPPARPPIKLHRVMQPMLRRLPSHPAPAPHCRSPGTSTPAGACRLPPPCAQTGAQTRAG